MSSLALASLFSACSVDDYIASKDEIIKKLGDFTFNTSNEVMVDIYYGPLAGNALVEIYGENPLADASAEDTEPKGETVFTTFLDKDGRYSGEVSIPSHVSELYAVSSSWGAPYVVKTDIIDGVATLQASATAGRHAVRQKADEQENYIVRPLKPAETGDGNVSNLWTISDGWNVYGKSNDANHLEDEGHLTNQDLADLQHFIWEGATSKPRTEDHKKFINGLKTDKANVVVVSQYTDPVTYKTIDVESAEVWFTFVNEYAWNENAMGYYYYPEGTTPNKNNLKMFIIVPNASVANNNPFGMANSSGFHSNEDAPVKTNHRVQLLYVDDQGNVSKNFPPGTDIGFFTIVNGFHLGSKYGTEKTADGKYYTTRTKGGISTAATRYYSNREFNGGTDHYIAVRMEDGTVVYGVEDGSDGSFDDVLFTVTASPNLSIKPEAENVAEIPHEHVQEKFTTDKSKRFTYLFEDIWPNGGDYDLNDVVVRHSREVTYNQYSYVNEVKETFKIEATPTTSDKDAIAFIIPEEHMSSELILPEGAVYEEETRSVFLTDQASKLYDKTVTVIRRGFQGVRKDDILKEFLNPYIVNQTGRPAWNEQGRIEIHLANATHYNDVVVTSKAYEVSDPILAAYIDKNGRIPYAIEIPNTSFVPCEPGVKIGSESGAYPNFTKWVESLGKSYTDWYNNK